MRSAPRLAFILIFTLCPIPIGSAQAQTLGSIDPQGTASEPDGGVHEHPPDSAIHSVTIHSDSESFALSGGARRVPMSALSQWCNVPPERAYDLIILTDPTLPSSVSVNFVGIDAKMYGGLVAGFNQSATLRSGAHAYQMTLGYHQPTCDTDLTTIKPFNDYITNTLTLEHKAGMQFAIYNVTSTTADPLAQTLPRKVTSVSRPSIPGPNTTDTQPTNLPETGDKPGAAPLGVIIAPVVVVGMCVILGLVMLYVCVLRPRKLRYKKLYGAISLNAPNRVIPPVRKHEREPTRVPLLPSLFGSKYFGARRPASSAGSSDEPIQPYRVVPDSYAPEPPPKAALIDLTNKRPVRPIYLPTSGASGSSSQHHGLHANPQKSSLTAWKAGDSPPVCSADQIALTRSPSLASETPGTSASATMRDPRTLAALERAVLGAGFSTQALLESLNRVREGRTRGMDSETDSMGADELPRYRLR